MTASGWHGTCHAHVTPGATSWREAGDGSRPAERPVVILAQPTLFDPSRAPEGKHIAWAYCHLPNGGTTDMTDRSEAQIERFAPGFRDRIIARHAMGPAELQLTAHTDLVTISHLRLGPEPLDLPPCRHVLSRAHRE